MNHTNNLSGTRKVWLHISIIHFVLARWEGIKLSRMFKIVMKFCDFGIFSLIVTTAMRSHPLSTAEISTKNCWCHWLHLFSWDLEFSSCYSGLEFMYDDKNFVAIGRKAVYMNNQLFCNNLRRTVLLSMA